MWRRPAGFMAMLGHQRPPKSGGYKNRLFTLARSKCSFILSKIFKQNGQISMRIYGFLALLGLVGSAACAQDHDPLRFVVSGDEIFAIGEIDSESLALFQQIAADHPSAKTLVLQYVGGSVDDAANVAFARVVRDMGLRTRVPSDGLIASGGTDLFLAGVDRVLETGACVGVHSWAAQDYTATDLPRSDPEHDRYLSYYADMQIDPDFYWFTVNAAPSDGMHWMTAAEAVRFETATQQITSLANQATCDKR
jgi:hypothetical protein